MRTRGHRPAVQGATRPPLERMLRIHQAIAGGEYPNASRLAVELEVSTKSVHRDIDFMRDRLELPLAYDASRLGYYYTEAVSGFPAFQITEGELFALLVAEKALQQYRGTAFEKPLISAFRKLAAGLPDPISIHLADWDKSISFRTSAEPILNLETFDLLSKATARGQQLKLRYRKPGCRDFEARIVDPYHLANVNGEWFLFAYCHLRGDVRTFAPARIQSAETTGKTFSRPSRFSIEESLRNSFGIHSGQGDFKIRIRFTEMVADYIREKKWHPSQKIIELPNGELELELRLSSLVEIERWVLGWSGHAVVHEPDELRSAVRSAAERILSAQSTSRP